MKVNGFINAKIYCYQCTKLHLVLKDSIRANQCFLLVTLPKRLGLTHSKVSLSAGCIRYMLILNGPIIQYSNYLYQNLIS